MKKKDPSYGFDFRGDTELGPYIRSMHGLTWNLLLL